MTRAGRSPLMVAGGVALTAGVALVVASLLVGGLPTAANVAELVSFGLAVSSFAAARLRSRSLPADPPQTETVRPAADALAHAVFTQWTNEARIRSLGDPNPMPVRWRLTNHKKVMDHPSLVAAEGLSFTGTADRVQDLARWFRGLDRRRLVILGDPGTGKTTLAVQLALALADPDTRAPTDPVPVLLPVAGWDTQAHRTLRDWLTIRLAADYPGLRGADPLVTSGKVLPILDGLDELPEPARATVIRAINESLADHDGLILTSRTTEYADAVDAAGHVLRSAAVIEPDPLTPTDVANYLHDCLPPEPGPTWVRVLAALRTSTASPLTDSLMVPLKALGPRRRSPLAGLPRPPPQRAR